MAVTKKQIGYMLETLSNIRKKIHNLDKLTLQLNHALYSVYGKMLGDVEEVAVAVATPEIVPESVAAAAWYSVSLGNGNDGVSRSHPDYYVKTDKPYDLAIAGLLNTVDADLWDRMQDEVDTHGNEPKWGISATLHEGPNGETEFGAAWRICEVWPVEAEDLNERLEPDGGQPQHDSLKSCFNVDLLKLIQKD